MTVAVLQSGNHTIARETHVARFVSWLAVQM
jgi:hypothetical protein